MFLKPRKEDFQIIGYYLGKLSAGLGIAMLLPLAAAFYYREWNAALDFIVGATIALILGRLLTLVRPRKTDLSWANGVVIAGLSWLVAMFLAAVPLYLSGHYQAFVDALFET
ncbi:MAG TPA: TrkH family potassium uptake protein, partial [bacterium]|nr:TrkH family potassium uptake protein [bacterium]